MKLYECVAVMETEDNGDINFKVLTDVVLIAAKDIEHAKQKAFRKVAGDNTEDKIEILARPFLQ